MWRLNLRKQYVDAVFRAQKFFVNGPHAFDDGDILLLQVVKQDEPGRVIKRIKGFMLFDRMEEDVSNESEALYGTKWKYAIIGRKTVKLEYFDKFNLEDVLGLSRSRQYYGQAEAVRFSPQDEAALKIWMLRFLS